MGLTAVLADLLGIRLEYILQYISQPWEVVTAAGAGGYRAKLATGAVVN